MISPGAMPVKNSLVIDSCAATPNSTSGIAGGRIGAMHAAPTVIHHAAPAPAMPMQSPTESATGGTPKPVRKALFRPRTLIYFGIWGAIGLAMLFSLGQRTRLDIAVQRERSPLYVQLSDGHIRNNYTLKLRNMEARPNRVEIVATGLPGAVLWTTGGSRETATQRITVTVTPDSVTPIKLFVAAPREGPTHQEFAIEARSLEATATRANIDTDTTQFERPEG